MEESADAGALRAEVGCAAGGDAANVEDGTEVSPGTCRLEIEDKRPAASLMRALDVAYSAHLRCSDRLCIALTRSDLLCEETEQVSNALTLCSRGRAELIDRGSV